MRDKVSRVLWTYGRGWLLLLVLYLVGRATSGAYSKIDEANETIFRSFESAVPNTIVAITILILGPWALGRIAERFLAGQLFQRQRGLRAFQRMEKR